MARGSCERYTSRASGSWREALELSDRMAQLARMIYGKSRISPFSRVRKDLS